MAPALLEPPVNVLRLTLHPEGAAPRIANLAEWRAHIFGRLTRQIELTADPVLVELLRELRAYPAPDATDAPDAPAAGRDAADVLVPMQLTTPAGTLSLVSTTTVFGTPVEVTLSELALETFFPADEATAALLRRFAEEQP
jgi:hypothetical protein